jgi:hypothetical protein
MATLCDVDRYNMPCYWYDMANKPRRGTLEATLAALRDADARLREVAAATASAGDYDRLAVIARWAKALQSLTAEVAAGDGEPTQGPLSDVNFKAASRSLPALDTSKEASCLLPNGPVYYRDTDFLIKRARGRTSGADYQHRAPREVVSGVAECLSEWRPAKKLLSGEQILKSYADKRDSAVSYQIYAALGWLTQLGLVRRHGRSGYSVPSPATICDDASKAWAALATANPNSID